MPEAELTRDPFGANRGKSFREQSAVLSTRVKNHLHEKYYIPPYRPTNRNWEMTFASLGYNRKTIEKFWRLFCQINHCTGEIQLEHFLEHFGLDWTPWTERCFKHFDTTGGGDIDFLEFMISVWNVCTFKIDSLSNFTFDMYDLDVDGELSIPEIERMVNELFGEGRGKQCSREAIAFAEARGGALNLNSFIAFTGSHQLLLLPIFQIQRKLQRKVFGIRFWEKIERASPENFNSQNKNEFNPRHVQILLRTYQTGGAAAVLNHTGDPNKGLRDWYENQKHQDNEEVGDEAQTTNKSKTGLQRWGLLRDQVHGKEEARLKWGNVRGNILDGNIISRFRRRSVSKAGVDANENTTQHGRPAPALPAKVALDLKRIREIRKEKVSEEKDANGSNTPTAGPTSDNNLPANVADDLKRIRERRAREAEAATNGDGTPSKRPSSAADLPPNVAADLQSTRARRSRKGTGKRNDRPRSRAKSTAVHNGPTRQRQAGSMFFKPDAPTKGGSKGWLE